MYRIKDKFKGNVFLPMKGGGIVTLNDNLTQEELEMLFKKYKHPAVMKEKAKPVSKPKKEKKIKEVEDGLEDDLAKYDFYPEGDPKKPCKGCP